MHILPRILFSKRADRKHRSGVLQGHSQIPSSTSVQVSCQQRLQAVTVGGRGNQGEKQKTKPTKNPNSRCHCKLILTNEK